MEISISTPTDFSFYETVSSHGWLRLLPFTWHDHAGADWTDWRPPMPIDGRSTGVLERVEELTDGLVALLRIYETENGLTVDVPGIDDSNAPAIAQRVRRMLQLDLDIAPFHAYCRQHLALAGVPDRRQGRLLRAPTLFEDVVKVITTTNTMWTQTKGMVKRMVDEFGAPLETDPTRRAFPSPAAIAGTGAEDFAARARLGYRNASVHALACDICEGRLDLESWQDEPMTAAGLEKRVLALRGIGPYAAACLMLYLGKPSKVNCDSWARTMVGKELGRKVTDKDVHAFFAQYGEWKALAYHFYAWQSAVDKQ